MSPEINPEPVSFDPIPCGRTVQSTSADRWASDPATVQLRDDRARGVKIAQNAPSATCA